MKKWHIKITLECVETNNKAVFDVNMLDKEVNINLDDFDADTWSELFWQSFIGILDLLWMRDKFEINF